MILWQTCGKQWGVVSAALVGIVGFVSCQPDSRPGSRDEASEVSADAPAMARRAQDSPLLPRWSEAFADIPFDFFDPAVQPERFKNATADELQRWGDAGQGDAWVEMGRRFATGQGQAVDLTLAAQSYYRAAQLQQVDAMVCLGMLHRQGRGVRRDELASTAWFRMAALRGHPLGMTRLGEAYLHGRGVRSDREMAARWLGQAAARGEPEAMWVIADLWERGLLGEVNREEADRWRAQSRLTMESAAANGKWRALRWLAEQALVAAGAAPDLERACQWLRAAAEQGDAIAMTRLAEVTWSGIANKSLRTEALEWCSRAVALGEPAALLLMARLCEQGDGVPRDLVQAMALRRQAAERGDLLGMRLYADMLFQGAGPRHDVREALQWYELAASRGDGPSLARIGKCFLEGDIYSRDEATAASYFSRGAAMNDPESLFQLGALQETDHASPQHLASAVASYRRAAAQGHDEAMFALAELLRRQHPERPMSSEALGWYERAALRGHRRAALRLADAYESGEGVAPDKRQAHYWQSAAERVDAATPGAEDTSEQVIAPAKETEFGTLVDPLESCAVQRNGSALQFTVPGGSFQLVPNRATAPRLMQQMEGDLLIRATLPGAWGQAADTPPQPLPCLRGAGLLIWESEWNFVRLDRGWIHLDDGWHHVCMLTIFVDGESTWQDYREIPDGSVMLQLERRAGRIRAAFSADEGQTWNPLRSQPTRLGHVVETGVAVYNESAQSLAIEVESLTRLRARE